MRTRLTSSSIPSGFSIIEVLIGIFVFSLGMVSVYALLHSSLSINDYNKNAIIASNLAREQVELLRNIRDTNYQKFTVWNNAGSTTFQADTYYTLSQNLTNGDILLSPISSFSEWKDKLDSSGMKSYRLCFTPEQYYVYCNTSPSLKTTPFYKYIYIQQAKDTSWVDIPWAFQVTSKVIWYKRGYHEFDIKTFITDWRRI